eukprot:CAMPEP_0194362994 /NCGR_PEP_ID=MMETSP0174-20130528/10910_1 /TAXON_ID=216777 /ORGANISM="Proboscia alata, Strain PI-D3" /LENGTH=395 /DNA_ID=CAMNT_0039136283 /DNA_START=423 /DNA_END=1607 /DNA_ORIENTATION=-
MEQATVVAQSFQNRFFPQSDKNKSTLGRQNLILVANLITTDIFRSTSGTKSILFGKNSRSILKTPHMYDFVDFLDALKSIDIEGKTYLGRGRYKNSVICLWENQFLSNYNEDDFFYGYLLEHAVALICETVKYEIPERNHQIMDLERQISRLESHLISLNRESSNKKVISHPRLHQHQDGINDARETMACRHEDRNEHIIEWKRQVRKALLDIHPLATQVLDAITYYENFQCYIVSGVRVKDEDNNPILPTLCCKSSSSTSQNVLKNFLQKLVVPHHMNKNDNFESNAMTSGVEADIMNISKSKFRNEIQLELFEIETFLFRRKTEVSSDEIFPTIEEGNDLGERIPARSSKTLSVQKQMNFEVESEDSSSSLINMPKSPKSQLDSYSKAAISVK